MSGLTIHTIDPIYNKNSKILILGTMPSPKSREIGFYYAHPQNKFWRILYEIFNEPLPETDHRGIPAKKSFLLKNKIALWDVLKSCDIDGASDESIKNPVPNDLSVILCTSKIKAVFTTGKKAAMLYKKYNSGLNAEHFCLPSTSPANCRFYTFEDLIAAYKIILKYI